MSTRRSRCGPRAVTVAGLLGGAVGIAVLWVSGRISRPVYPPPGIIVLTIGAPLVGLTHGDGHQAWARSMGLVMFVGVGLSGGPPNLIDHKGTTVAVGNWIMIVAGCTVGRRSSPPGRPPQAGPNPVMHRHWRNE